MRLWQEWRLRSLQWMNVWYEREMGGDLPNGSSVLLVAIILFSLWCHTLFLVFFLWLVLWWMDGSFCDLLYWVAIVTYDYFFGTSSTCEISLNHFFCNDTCACDLVISLIIWRISLSEAWAYAVGASCLSFKFPSPSLSWCDSDTVPFLMLRAGVQRWQGDAESTESIMTLESNLSFKLSWWIGSWNHQTSARDFELQCLSWFSGTALLSSQLICMHVLSLSYTPWRINRSLVVVGLLDTKRSRWCLVQYKTATRNHKIRRQRLVPFYIYV